MEKEITANFGITAGTYLTRDHGLNLSHPNEHNGLSGIMSKEDDHFVAEGIPVTPVDDDGVWNPYQIAEITIKDAFNNVYAQVQTTVPTSDEINCARCHGDDPFQDILIKHDTMHNTKLIDSKPILCAQCHGSPALGGDKPLVRYLSQVIHESHSDRNANCYDCHPGEQTSCNRSKAHYRADGNCETCHGDMHNVANSIASGSRVPWMDEPSCVNCHVRISGVDTGEQLFRHSIGHGDIYCAACHGSPHAMYPSLQASDNAQVLQYQKRAVSVGSCAACHETSKGGEDEEEDEDEEDETIKKFMEKHGGSNAERSSACNICHTAIPNNVSQWPHAFQWRDR